MTPDSSGDAWAVRCRGAGLVLLKYDGGAHYQSGVAFLGPSSCRGPLPGSLPQTASRRGCPGSGPGHRGRPRGVHAARGLSAPVGVPPGGPGPDQRVCPHGPAGDRGRGGGRLLLQQHAYAAAAINGTDLGTSAGDACGLLSQRARRLAAVSCFGDFVVFLGKVLVASFTVLGG
ncbi:choline transporter-like protein 3 [Phyllostomus hastatus]|uniref:choline transporter-like protein 3 n=1 Tax=Phyllostomus hastatus TaxID=9423 RepID=UPI001E6810E2|nr:choline transporter-like protein 3 [Phyllostomus hastatus]